MPNTSRFECASSSLTLKGLLRKTKRAIWICFAVGAVTHLSLTQFVALEAERKGVKPLSTQFIKRQPRLTKPLELKRRPRPKRRPVKRTMVSVKARVRRGQEISRFQSYRITGELSKPTVRVHRTLEGASTQAEPEALAATIEGKREAEHKIDMSLEMLDIEAMDTGKYHAMVIQDPGDKKNVGGFCHLAVAHLKGAYYQTRDQGTFEFYCVPGFMRLAARLNDYTDIKADIWGRLSLDDAELFKVPWLLLNARRSFQPDNAELENLGRYLTHGGFAFVDAEGHRIQNMGWTPGLKALHTTLMESLKTQGIQAALEKLANSHPIYHCYFDFDGPPIGGDASDHSQHPEQCLMWRFLEGIELNGRLVALFSRKHYTGAWTFYGPDNYVGYAAWMSLDPTRSFQFGVNTIIFALTQEGSITYQVMDSVK